MMNLYTYWRSSTAYRVRIALHLKGLEYEPVFISLVNSEQHTALYRAVNPQGLVPALIDDGKLYVQSLAIIEYLEERYPRVPLLPADLDERAYVRALAQLVACEIHPLNNVRVLHYLEKELGAGPAKRKEWYANWVAEGLAAFEATIARYDYSGRFCCGDVPGLADLCLVPQMYNAVRYGCSLDEYPRLQAIREACEALPAFAMAHPARQPDAF